MLERATARDGQARAVFTSICTDDYCRRLSLKRCRDRWARAGRVAPAVRVAPIAPVGPAVAVAPVGRHAMSAAPAAAVVPARRAVPEQIYL